MLFDPGAKKNLKATCSHCHTPDGRDLKYFNFSSWSIEARSVFHKLTAVQGKQIASYIRSLPTPAPTQVRPWNPPYQPGPGLDARPVEEWSAGAGLDAALPRNADTLWYIFPDGLNRADMKRRMETTANLNLRELPMALQLPDWNEWLPTTHPVDIWVDFDAQGAAQSMAAARKTLSTRGIVSLIAEKSLHAILGDTHRATMAWALQRRTAGFSCATTSHGYSTLTNADTSHSWENWTPSSLGFAVKSPRRCWSPGSTLWLDLKWPFRLGRGRQQRPTSPHGFFAGLVWSAATMFPLRHLRRWALVTAPTKPLTISFST